jgi:DNA-binding transcriptional LysR family regulator
VELRQLHYFAVVAEELNFGRAAERLHIVQSAVSQQVRRLEHELGGELFDRTTRRVALTEFGRAFLPWARAVIEAEERARAFAYEFPRRPVTRLRVGSATGLGRRLRRALVDFSESCPDVDVELLNLPAGERLRAVRDGVLDVAVVRGPASDDGLRLEPVWDDELLVVLPAGHELAGPGPVDLAALAAIPLRLVERSRNPVLVDALTGACRAAGFEPVPVGGRPVGNDADLLASIASGRPTWTIYYADRARQLDADEFGVAFVPLAAPGLSIPTALAIRPDEPRPEVLGFVAACRGQDEI